MPNNYGDGHRVDVIGDGVAGVVRVVDRGKKDDASVEQSVEGVGNHKACGKEVTHANSPTSAKQLQVVLYNSLAYNIPLQTPHPPLVQTTQPTHARSASDLTDVYKLVGNQVDEIEQHISKQPLC